MSRKYIDRELLINEICKNRLMSKELVAQKILHIINEQPTVNVDEERLKMINNCADEVERYKTAKMKRLKARITK